MTIFAISPRRTTVPSPLAGRLISHPRVIRAVRQAGDGVAAAKEELAAAKDRPPARDATTKRDALAL